MFPQAPELQTKRLILSPLSKKYASEAYVSWMNDIDVYRYLESGGDYTFEQLQTYLEEVEKMNIFFWAIRIKENNKHIGNIKIDPINVRHAKGEYGILMGDQTEWGKGYAKEASEAVIDFCFTELQLRKITLGVVANNMSAVKLYTKLGFEVEGVYKKHGIYGSEYCDIIQMAFFNPKLDI